MQNFGCDGQKMMTDPVEYSFVGPDDGPEIDDLLVTQFFKHEPLGVELGSEPESDVRPWLSKITAPMIEQGVRKSQEFARVVF